MWTSGPIGDRVRGVAGSLRAGRVPARALAIADSRSLVRSLFLASAVQLDVLGALRRGRTFDQLIGDLGCTRPERLQAWLWTGTELGELAVGGDRYRVRGVRARALAAGDPLLAAHYRTMVEYQTGPYAELGPLLRDVAGVGRDDLDRYADDIAQVSLAAAPFIGALLHRVMGEVRPARVLDAGCGSGVYSRVVLDADPQVRVDGVDLSEQVIERCREELDRAGHGDRARLHVGDARRWVTDAAVAGDRFDLILLLNNIYYFDRRDRVDLYRELGAVLTGRGQVLVASMLAPGSVAAAHLHLMLACQAGAASLPGPGELGSDLGAAGYRVLGEERLVPTEPLVAVRATWPALSNRGGGTA